MSSVPSPSPSAATTATAQALARWAPLVIVALTLAAYARSFSGPFVFDDIGSIVENPTIRRLWPLSEALSPPHAEGATVGGRPLLNFTFALNHAISGEAVWSYHAGNLLLHIANALLLLGLVRRALTTRPAIADARPAPWLVATTIAALWALHPLQTESVAYVAQRAEALAAFFLLLTLYAFARGVTVPAPRWLAGSVAACLAGMASKETMVTAPLIVLLYDRTWVSGSFRAAWAQRRGYYLALAATWLLLGWLVWRSGGTRGDTAGLGTSLSPLDYALTQCAAIVRYLRLVFWPNPLVFDYGNAVVTRVADVGPQLALVVTLLALTVVALRRWPAAGFAGAAFFLLLAPSSSVVPIASQTVAEHRMYLPLAALLALLVVWLVRHLRPMGVALGALASIAAFAATRARVQDYTSELALWAATVRAVPENARAHNNLATALLERRRTSEAVAHYETALRLRPDYADAHNNLGHVLIEQDRADAALPHFEAALRVKPNSPATLSNLGRAFARLRRDEAALAAYARALEFAPEAIPPRFNRGNLHLRRGQWAEAIADYERVLTLQPAHIDARFNLAKALTQLRRPDEAIAQYQKLLGFAPRDAFARAEFAVLLAAKGRIPEAITHLETALTLTPDFPAARDFLNRLRATAPSTPR